MVAFVASAVLTAANLNAAFNAYTVNSQTGTTYTFVLTDRGGLVTASNSAASTYTLPTNASVAYATGTRLYLLNIGAGTVTLAAPAGGTLTGTLQVPTGVRVQLIKTGTNTWFVSGAEAGMQLISTTALSAVASVSVNDVFTASAPNYLAVLSLTSISAAHPRISLRMRVAGVDNSSAVYYTSTVTMASNSTTVTGEKTEGSSAFDLGVTGDATFAYVIPVFIGQPQATENTTISASAASYYTTNLSRFISTGGAMNVTTSYDGCTFLVSSGTMTGSLSIYRMAV